ncbi:hypothetical protein NDU88_003851 [Pleurodeles waltl]|uniref:Uncharacterized protein n=1 Tax=Pleurodeles waltl TaxID=8319 RepID=A0AAV7V069_PLEWA|nr:hypothetical protein NDU88_003851 [Pleurodeles waltl]
MEDAPAVELYPSVSRAPVLLLINWEIIAPSYFVPRLYIFTDGYQKNSKRHLAAQLLGLRITPDWQERTDGQETSGKRSDVL